MSATANFWQIALGPWFFCSGRKSIGLRGGLQECGVAASALGMYGG